MKIAVFLPSLLGGGAEKVTLNLCRGLRGRGIDVDMVLAQASGEYLGQVPAGVRIVDLKCRRTLSALPGLIGYLRTESPAVLLSAIDHANVVALWAKRLANVPTRSVITLHTDIAQAFRQERRLKYRLMSHCVRRSYPLADKMIAVSQGVARSTASFLGLPGERIRVIYNPVVMPEMFEMAEAEVDHPWVLDRRVPLVLAIGRLSEQKDYDTLLRAFDEVRSRRAVRLLILGEGEERSRLEKMIADMGLSAVVSMPGFVANPFAYLRKADVLVLSSKAEGLPTVLVEALALGTPVVSSDCRSGPDEILGGGRWGALVPVGDAQAMAEAILCSLETPRTISQESISPFLLETVIDNYMEVFRA